MALFDGTEDASSESVETRCCQHRHLCDLASQAVADRQTVLFRFALPTFDDG